MRTVYIQMVNSKNGTGKNGKGKNGTVKMAQVAKQEKMAQTVF